MAEPEQQKAPEKRDSKVEATESREFDVKIQGLDRALGNPLPVPDNASDEQLLSLTKPANDRGAVTGFTELMRANEVVYKRKAIQHAADLGSGQIRTQTFNSGEYVVASQLGTYFEGLEESVRYMSESLKDHAALSDIIAALPKAAQDKIAGRRMQASLYIASLTRSLDERVAFANARKLQFAMAKKPDDQALKTQYEAVLKHPALTEESKSALQSTPQTAGDWTANLDKTILRVLEGTQPIDGVDQGFLPQHIYIDVLQARYTQLLEEQKKLVRDKARDREGGQVALDLIGKEREGIMAEMISYTNELGRYQMRLSRLFATQNLFKNVDTDGAWMSPEGSTPKIEKDKTGEAMKAEKTFHLDALDGMTTTASKEFTPGIFEALRDGIVNSTITSTELALRIMNVLKIADFGTGALSGRVKDFLVGPIAEAMGWPRDPQTGELKNPKDLTQKEREAMAGKVGQLRDVMNAFQRESGSADVLETSKAIRALDAAEGIGAFKIGRVQEPLPVESAPMKASDVSGKLQQYEAKYGNREDAVATLQAVLFRQLEGQWGQLDGSGKGGTGFIGSYARMLSEFERIIGVQLDLAGAAFTVSQRYFNLAKGMAIGAAGLGIASLFAGGLAAHAGVKVASKAVRAPVNMARRLILGRAPAERTALRTGPRATGVQRALWAGAVAYEAYNVYSNIEEIQRDNERIKETKGEIEAQLIKAGFVKTVADTYEHPLGPKVSLKEIYEGVDQQRAIQYARTGVAAAELGATLLMGARLLIGRAGLVFAAVSITVEAGITSYQNQAARDFLANPDTPPWLIAALGTQKLVKQSEYDMLVNSSSWNFLFTSSEQTKGDVRKKMYFTLFNQELGGFAPELFRELYAGRMNVGEIDRFYAEDFQNMVMPYAMVRLFRTAQAKGSSAGWEQISRGKVDRGTVIFPPDLTHVEIRQAMRESAVFYVQHLREKHFTRLLVEEALVKKQLEKEPNSTTLRMKLADTQAVLRALGDQHVLGSRIGDTINADNAASLSGKTRAEAILELLKTKAENGKDLILEDLNLPGLKGTADFRTAAAFLNRFVTDPALRTNAERVQPLTTNEPEGRIYPAWNDWKGNFNRLFRLPTGLDEGHTNLMINHAAKNVWQGIDPKAKFGDLSDGEARNKITEGAIGYFEKTIEKQGYSLNESLSKSLYGGQIPVFGSVEGGEQTKMLQSVATPSQSDRAFGIEHVKAVIVSGDRIDANGHRVVLATFVYGQPGSMYFLQNAVATSATSRSTGYNVGESMAYDEKEFRKTAIGKGFGKSVEAELNQMILRRREADRLRGVEQEQQRRKAALEAAQKQAEMEDAAVQRDNLREMTAKAKPDRLSKISDRWKKEAYRMLYTDPDTKVSSLVTYGNYSDTDTPSFNALPTDGRQEPEANYLIIVEGPGGRKIKIDLATFEDQKTTPADRRLMQEFIVSPIAGREQDSLLKVLNLFPYDNFISSWRTDHYYKGELLRELLPLYNRTSDYEKAQSFLNELFQKLRRAKAITSDSKDEIVEWFDDHKAMFGIKE